MSETGMKEKEHTIRDNQLDEAKNEETESYETSIRRRPLMRVAAWICLGILAALSLMIAVSNFPVIKESMKMNKDTEAYYEYIHEYNKNFMNFRY